MPHQSAARLASPLSFSDRLREFRSMRKLQQEELASLLGVPLHKVRRWETGTSLPDKQAAELLTQNGFGAIELSDTNASSRSRIKTAAEQSHEHLRELDFEFAELPGAIPPSWARNGQPDQDEFYRKLIKLQLEGLSNTGLSYTRLSLVQEFESGTRTTQNLLEAPKASASSWNSNYGSHGWHRYVGRFPPHVVRALLNHFAADNNSLVCDPFSGSGTTAVECRFLGIPFVGIEIGALSHLLGKVKAGFDSNPTILAQLSRNYSDRMRRDITAFTDNAAATYSIDDVLNRYESFVPRFSNIEKWFTPRAFLGVALTMKFASTLQGFEKDALLLALSSKMRSIGNVDVDVVRAEYSKKPRTNVFVERLVASQLNKMALDIVRINETHGATLQDSSSIKLIEGSALEVDIEPSSVDCIITSPPYGVEALSYLRTHLLSYRSLANELDHDPYDTRDQTIGSEYLEEEKLPPELQVAKASKIFRSCFSEIDPSLDKKTRLRRVGMMKFFEDMHSMGHRMATWLKDGGKLAFIIGNKRLGETVIPTDTIIEESFRASGLVMYDSIRHKLKTNNSNSQVPWQERIIQEETTLLFRRGDRA